MSNAWYLYARTNQGGQEWFIVGTGEPRSGNPPGAVAEHVIALSLAPRAPELEAFPLDRDGQSWAVVVTNLATAQKRASSPEPRAAFAFVGSKAQVERVVGALQPAVEAGEASERLGDLVVDGPDAYSVGLAAGAAKMLGEMIEAAPAGLLSSAPSRRLADVRRIDGGDRGGGQWSANASRLPGRGLMDVLVWGGLIGLAVTVLLALWAVFSLVGVVRQAIGLQPPSSGPDWIYLATIGALVILSVFALSWTRRRLHRAIRDRAWSYLPANYALQPYSGRRSAAPLEVERSLAGAYRSIDSEDRSIDAFRAELRTAITQRAVATGVSIAMSRHRGADALIVVAASIEMQIEVCARLGVEPTARGWLSMARTAFAGLFVATYLDIENRLEVEMAMKAAALGIDIVAEGLDEVGDVVKEDVSDLMMESLDGGLGAVAGFASLFTGGVVGLSAASLRRLADFVDQVGAEVGEGVVVGAMLSDMARGIAEHVVDLAEDKGDRIHGVDAGVFDACKAIARRRTHNYRRLLRDRAAGISRLAKTRAGGS